MNQRIIGLPDIFERERKLGEQVGWHGKDVKYLA